MRISRNSAIFITFLVVQVTLVAAADTSYAQLSDADVVLRIDRLEGEIRRLTGTVEQLQYRNQQLEQELRRLQGVDARPPQTGIAPVQSAMPAPQGPAMVEQSPPAAEPAPIAAGRRSDAFDPTQSPGAPGAPRTLGVLPEGAPPPAGFPPAPPTLPADRVAGAPLDLTTPSERIGGGPGLPAPFPNDAPLPPPPPRNPNATGVQTVMAPSQTPKDEYDLAYGYMLHKDYALAENSFRIFLKKYPNDRLSPEANYWLGEAMFQRQRYRDAAEAFLSVSTRYETMAKAPDALLRLGQSLAALGEKDAACATFSEVGRKYPRASIHIKQGVEREQRRSGC